MKLHDDPLLESFASDLRREFSPALPSPDLARGVAAALAAPSMSSSPSVATASWMTMFLQSRPWFSWTSFATVVVAAVALMIGILNPDRKSVSGGGQTGNEHSPDAAAVAVSPAATGAESFPRTAPRSAVIPASVTESESSNSASRLYQPVVLRDRREFVDTLRWRDRRTGARVEVSYPRSEFRLVAAEPM